MSADNSFSRRIAARAPLLASLAGMTIAFSSAVFFFVEGDVRRPMGVAVGFFCLLLAIWYASHPFVRNERTYLDLRAEIDKFLDLARGLHNAALNGDEARFESIKEGVPAQVELVIETARKSRPLDC